MFIFYSVVLVFDQIMNTDKNHYYSFDRRLYLTVLTVSDCLCFISDLYLGSLVALVPYRLIKSRQRGALY